jgi:hypothetical protein
MRQRAVSRLAISIGLVVIIMAIIFAVVQQSS